MEYVSHIDLTTPPQVGSPQLRQETLGVPITGVVVNGQLPAGLTLTVGRKGSQAMTIVAGGPAVGQGGDSLLDYWCPPQADGMQVSWDIAAPGSTIDLVWIGPGGEGQVSRA